MITQLIKMSPKSIELDIRAYDTTSLMDKVRKHSRQLTEYDLVCTQVAWEDNKRNPGSCWGSHICDLSICTNENGHNTMSPIIKRPNMRDHTFDVPISTFKVNSYKTDRIVTLTEALANPIDHLGFNCDFGRIDESTNVLTSTQACIIYKTMSDEPEFHLSAFNYCKRPVLYLIMSSDGLSACVGSWNTKLFHIKRGKNRPANAKSDTAHNFTAETTGVVSTDDMTEEQANQQCLEIFQIPLKYDGPDSSWKYTFSMSDSFRGGSRASHISAAKIGVAEDIVQEVEDIPSKLVRDTTVPIRCTVQYYYVTTALANPSEDAEFDEDFIEAIPHMAKALCNIHKCAVSQGSLVFDEQTADPVLAKLKKDHDKAQPTEVPTVAPSARSTYCFKPF